MPNTAIKVSHLTKVYKLYDKLKKKYHEDFYSLNDVSCDIRNGEK